MHFPLTEELSREIERQIERRSAERPIANKFEHEILTKHRALPLFRGAEGYLAIDLSGEIVEFEWGRPDEPLPTLFGRAYGVLVIGALKYPALATLLPARQPGDVPCIECGGSGEHPMLRETGDSRIICECGGLGFVPIKKPDGASAPTQTRSNAFPDILPSKYQSRRFYQVCSDYDIRDEAELQRLIHVMFDSPENEVVYFRPKDRAPNALLARAIADGWIAEGELEFFHYLREPGGRNFVHIERTGLSDNNAEFVFAWQKRHLLYCQKVASGEMFIRTTLVLTERLRRELDHERKLDNNIFEAKPGFFGFSVDLLKVLRWLKAKVRSWRSKPRLPDRTD